MTTRVRQQRRQQQPLLMNLHLLANPGDSLLLQHTLDRLLRWLCPSLRIFHVSERASPFRSYTRLCPVAGKAPVWAFMPEVHLVIQSGVRQILCMVAKPFCVCAFNLIAQFTRNFSCTDKKIISICGNKTSLQEF